jgi:polyisoprenoid-binding protein YceI
MTKNKISILSISAISLFLVSCGGKSTEATDAQQLAQATELSTTFKVDAAASKLGWLGKKVTGQHNGSINITEGSISIDKNNITAGSFVIDMKSITNEDITDAETKEKFLGHMLSPDFFDVEKYPSSKFEITGVEKMATADSMKILGNLTIKDVTKNIAVPAKVSITADSFEASSTFKIDRTDWNIQYGSGKFFKGLGDKMINDEIEFTLNLKAVPAK